ncbi:MAG: hypothetical protein CSB47_02850 [Proteobacteria bacterium]|nr:MAG: hypothetical protein CSB47_02850 [Pseudomonadota bacterium]
MSLPEPVEREHLHSRRVKCDAYRRADGLWDIDGQVVDFKHYFVEANEEGRTLEVGEPYHDLSLRMTIDQQFLIHEIHASMDATPFGMCPRITEAFKCLEGTRLGPGWHRKAKDLLGGTKGCTHLLELLKPVATTAIQAIWPMMDEQMRQYSSALALNTCHTWSQSSDVVREYFPKLYKAADQV